MLELLIAMTVLVVAFGIFSSTVAGVHRQQVINWQHGIASNVARSTLERMRNEEFADVFALYNADPTDDVGGVGSAPGSRFEVIDLPPASDSIDGLHGEIQFPDVDTSAGVSPLPLLELREDVDLPALGMPRDLSGDSIIDDADHAGDYAILPVRIVVRWSGMSGDHEYILTSTLCRYRWE